MTTTNNNSKDSIGRPNTPKEGYEWTCPYCGTSRLNTSDGEFGEKNAIVALRAHILASDGAAHGPRNEFPHDDALTLSDHVGKVEDRR